MNSMDLIEEQRCRLSAVVGAVLSAARDVLHHRDEEAFRDLRVLFELESREREQLQELIRLQAETVAAAGSP